jgi:hypothetical protein
MTKEVRNVCAQPVVCVCRALRVPSFARLSSKSATRSRDAYPPDRLADWDVVIVCISEFHAAIDAMWHGWDPSHPLHGAPCAKEALSGVYEGGDRLSESLWTTFLILLC